jgi:hypothetical protein
MKKCTDGHYEYIACYVDDVVSFSKDPTGVIKEFKKDCILKGVGEPEYYLGGTVDPLDDTSKEENVSPALSDRTTCQKRGRQVRDHLWRRTQTAKDPDVENIPSGDRRYPLT